MNVERPPRRTRGGVIAIVAWLVVLGGKIALGIAGRGASGPTAAVTAAPGRPSPTPLVVARGPQRGPLPTRPPIGEDGIMGGLPFGTAWQWLEPN